MTSYPPNCNIDWLDLREKMALQASVKFGKILMRIGDEAPVTVSYQTALAEAHRRCWHLSNLRFYDIDGTPAKKGEESPQCQRMIDFFITNLLSPHMRKEIRHLLPREELKGSVMRFDDPTKPVSTDWNALREPKRLYVQCQHCGWIYYAISAERLKRITAYDEPRYLQCRCGTPARDFVPVAAEALPRGATVNPIYGAPVDTVKLAEFEAAEDADEGLDERGYPVLPPAPLEDGKHWGMKYTIGWSNPSGCPDHAILWHSLARCDRAAIGEAIRHYGFERVQAYWQRMKEVGPIKKKVTVHSHGNGDLIESSIPIVDQILFKLENTRPPLVLVKCTHCGRVYFATSAEYLRRRKYPEARIKQLHSCHCGTPADRFMPADANDAPELVTLSPIITPVADPEAVADYEAWRETLDDTP